MLFVKESRLKELELRVSDLEKEVLLVASKTITALEKITAGIEYLMLDKRISEHLKDGNKRTE